jgi:Ca2+-binding RTX toxin-like protein
MNSQHGNSVKQQDTFRIITVSWGCLVQNFEDVTGNAFDDSLIGNADSNKVLGGAGNDSLDGGAGVDVLTGGGQAMTNLHWRIAVV